MSEADLHDAHEPEPDAAATAPDAPVDDAPEADVAEQRAVVGPDAAADELPRATGVDADEADVAEQHREVSLDEDDYR